MALSASRSLLSHLVGTTHGRDAAANLLRITLADTLRPLEDAMDIQRESARVIAEHFKVARASFASVDEDNGLVIIKQDYAKGVPSAIGSHRIANYGQPFRDDETQIFFSEDVSKERELEPALEYYQRLQAVSLVVVRLIRKHRFSAVLTVADNKVRRWRKSDIDLIAEAAERIWTALERVEAEAALRKSEELHRLVAQATHDILWDWNPETNRVEWNDALYEKLGYRPEEVSGIRAWGKLIHPADWQRVAARYYGGLKDGSNSWTDEYRLRRKDGSYAVLLDRGLIARDAADKTVRIVGSMMDITELRNAEAALRKANTQLLESDRRKDEFLAMLAHELRNPLAAAKNAAELLTLKMKENGNRRFVDVLLRQMQVLSGLVDDLLDVSRVTRGLITLKQDWVDLRSVAQSAMESVHGLFQAKHHNTELLTAGPTVVRGDAVRLEQILVNLLTNAAKYTDPGGQIKLYIETNKDVAKVRVQDNGIGIDPAVRDSIFALFGQAERGLDRSQGGLGIGLTIVKSLVELHGGRIEANSKGLGCGSEFVLTLPLATTTAVAQAADTKPVQDITESGKRILVVEDSEEIAQTLALLLEEAGHQVTTAANGPLALEKAERGAPDLVLLDIGLPGMDGYEIARRMRANPKTRDSTLAALTGYGQPSDQRLSEAAGFDAHFVKPVDFSVLRDYISHVKPRGPNAEYRT